MPPLELFAGLSPEQVLEQINKYKKFERRWSIAKIFTGIGIIVSFVFGSGVGFQKARDTYNSFWEFRETATKRIEHLEAFTGCPKLEDFETHKGRAKYLNSIKIKNESDKYE